MDLYETRWKNIENDFRRMTKNDKAVETDEERYQVKQ